MLPRLELTEDPTNNDKNKYIIFRNEFRKNKITKSKKTKSKKIITKRKINKKKTYKWFLF